MDNYIGNTVNNHILDWEVRGLKGYEIQAGICMTRITLGETDGRTNAKTPWKSKWCLVWGTERATASGKYWVREWCEVKTLLRPKGTCGEIELGSHRQFLTHLFWPKPLQGFKFVILCREEKSGLFKRIKYFFFYRLHFPHLSSKRLINQRDCNHGSISLGSEADINAYSRETSPC